MKPAILAGAGVVAILVGYTAGRYAQPARVETREKIVTKIVEVESKQTEASNVEIRTADVRTSTRWRIHVVERADGTVERTASGGSGSDATTQDRRAETSRETEVRYVDRIQEVEKVRVVEASRPAWGVALGAGVASGFRPVYRAEVERTVFGPFSIGVYGTTAKEAGVMARVRF